MLNTVANQNQYIIICQPQQIVSISPPTLQMNGLLNNENVYETVFLSNPDQQPLDFSWVHDEDEKNLMQFMLFPNSMGSHRRDTRECSSSDHQNEQQYKIKGGELSGLAEHHGIKLNNLKRFPIMKASMRAVRRLTKDLFVSFNEGKYYQMSGEEFFQSVVTFTQELCEKTDAAYEKLIILTAAFINDARVKKHKKFLQHLKECGHEQPLKTFTHLKDLLLNFSVGKLLALDSKYALQKFMGYLT